MSQIIPLFPLNIVVFPNEVVNLHVFEHRYLELVKYCTKEEKGFGIPLVAESKLMRIGTLMNIEHWLDTSKDSMIDIRTRGKELFFIKEILLPPTLDQFATAKVEFIPLDTQADADLLAEVKHKYKQVLEIHGVAFKEEPKFAIYSFGIGHHIGLTLEKKFELLTLSTENERLTFINKHLDEVIPQMINFENSKKRIHMNGSYRYEGPQNL